MSKSLYEFSKVKLESKKDEKQPINQENIEQLASNYANKSQGELLELFKNEVAKQKQNGTFDIAKLENSLDKLSGLLSPEQKKNIKELLNQIR